MSFCVLFVCKCVQYYCHRVTTQLQLTNMSYISFKEAERKHRLHTTSYLKFGHDCVIPRPLEIIIHWSVYHPTLCRVGNWQCCEEAITKRINTQDGWLCSLSNAFTEKRIMSLLIIVKILTWMKLAVGIMASVHYLFYTTLANAWVTAVILKNRVNFERRVKVVEHQDWS